MRGSPTQRSALVTVPAAAAVAAALAGFAACLALWLSGGGSVDVPWVPSLGLRLHFELDGLAALYGMLVTGIGVLVFAYAGAYLPRHLDEQDLPARDAPRFFGFLVLFMVAMAGLASAQDLILLFVFWDLTAIASYYLIGYDRHERHSREAALMALLVTGVSAVALLIAALVLQRAYGTFSIPALAERAQAGTTVTVASALIAVAGLAKSAQVPFQFWLPRAMAAPTPVSAYLHSAAMVAAGVFLLSRLYPLLVEAPAVLDALIVVGLASIVAGSLLALAADVLKQVLAYSTISQYGYVVFMLGLGGAKGAAAACFYVIAHAIAKAALFMTSGAVTRVTGAKRLSQVGGLARPLPWLAAGSLAAAAGLAALPLTMGFFKDELFFAAALGRGTGWAVASVAAAALTFAYVARFWAGLFLGPPGAAAQRAPLLLVGPVAVLGALMVAGGIVVGPFASLAAAAAGAMVTGPTPADAAYHLDARAENLMALAAYAGGALVLVACLRRPALVGWSAPLGERIGPVCLYRAGLAGLNRASDAVHDLEVRDLRTRVAAVLVPSGALVLAGVAVTPFAGAYEVGAFDSGDIVPGLVLVAAAGSGVAVTRPRDHLMLVLAISSVGFCLAAVYALLAAPDVALVAVVVEAVLALVFLGVLSLLPRSVLRREAAILIPRARRRRDALIATGAGLAVFAGVWGALSTPARQETVAVVYVEQTGAAHAKDTVTAILADFRGLDTLVETTVVVVALLAVVGLLGWRRTR